MNASAAVETTASLGPGHPTGLPPTAEIVRQNGAYLWRVLRHLGVPDSERDDAAQEVFLVVHRRRDSYDGRSQPRTWLFGIARRVASTRRRTRDRRRSAPLEDWSSAEPFEAPTQEQLADRGRLRELGLAILEELDEDKRLVFVLHEIEEHTMQEVAEAVGCPVKTAYARLYAARETMAKAARRALATGRLR